MNVRRRLVSAAVALALLATGVVAYSMRPLDAEIVVDARTRFQRISDWEATSWALSDDPQVFATFRDALLPRVVNDLGLTRIRLEVRSGSENTQDYFADARAGLTNGWRGRRYATVNDNSDPDSINWSGFIFTELDYKIDTVIQPLREAFARAGKPLRVHLCYVAFTGQIRDGGRYHHDDPREYGEFIEATWRHIQDKYGWVPDGLEIMLEPDKSPHWNGALVGKAIADVARRFTAARLTVPRIVAPSTANMGTAVTYFDEMIKVKGVKERLSELSYHRYGGVSAANLKAIQSRAAQYGLQTAMLEWIGANHHTLHEDLKTGWNSAWQQYVLAGPSANDDGAKYFLINRSDPEHPTVALGRRTQFFRQYFHYIRPGDQRIEATSSDSRMDPIAVQNDDGTTVVVVKSSRAGSLSVSGLPAGSYGLTYTVQGAAGSSLPDVTIRDAERVTATLPAEGVITIFGQKRGLQER